MQLKSLILYEIRFLHFRLSYFMIIILDSLEFVSLGTATRTRKMLMQ